MAVTNAQELTKRIQELKEAQKIFATYTQEQVDEIFRQAALAANNARIKLAKMAVEETGMGIVEDKVIKNHFAAEYIYNQYKDMKTCGVLEEDKTFGVTKIAEPIGVIAAIVPTTNPTSTAIFKTLIALLLLFPPLNSLNNRYIINPKTATLKPKYKRLTINEPPPIVPTLEIPHPNINFPTFLKSNRIIKKSYEEIMNLKVIQLQIYFPFLTHS